MLAWDYLDSGFHFDLVVAPILLAALVLFVIREKKRP